MRPSRNRALLRTFLTTGIVLMIPLIAMQFTSEVSWGAMDFIIMGSILLIAGGLYELLTYKTQGKYRLAVGVAIAMAVVYVWAELAVGIFTDLGS